MYIPMYIFFTHNLFIHIIYSCILLVTTVLEVLRGESTRDFGEGHVETLLLSSDTISGVPKCSVARRTPAGRSIAFGELAKRPTCLGPYDRQAWRLQVQDHAECED